MNIWYFNHYAGGPGIGKFSRAYHLGRAWATQGHKTTVFMACWHHLLERQEKMPREKVVDGVRYVALDARRYEGNGWGRILNMFDYCRSLLRVARWKDLPRPDAIIVSSPHPFGIFSAWPLAWWFGAKLVFEVRDLWPLSIVEISGTSRWHPFVLLCALAERFAYRRSHLVGSLLSGAEPYMRGKGLAPGKFVYVPNGVDAARSPVGEPSSSAAIQASALIERWHDEHRLVIIHPGAQGAPNALDLLLDAVACLNREGFADRFGVLLVGEGSKTAELKQQAETSGLRNVVFFPPLPKEDALSLIARSDIGYAGARNIPNLYRYGISFNKIADFMQAGLPIILPLKADNDPVSKAGCGIVVGSDLSTDIARAILQLLESSPASRANLGRKGREYVCEALDYDNIARRYMEAIETC